MSVKKMERSSGVNIRASTVRVAVLGLLTALATVLAMFTIRPNQSMKISLDFIPVVIAAYIYGPVGSGLVAGLADIIGCIVKPSGMIYPPITLTAVAVGVIFGAFLKQRTGFLRIIISVGITQLIISMFVTPIWLYYLIGLNYYVNLGVRLPQIAIMVTAELIVIPLILKSLEKMNVLKLLSVRPDSPLMGKGKYLNNKKHRNHKNPKKHKKRK